VASRFGPIEWQQAVSRLIASADAAATARALIAAVDVAAEHEGTCLLAFHRGAPPDVLHHTLEPAGEKHYVDRYLAGPYLLDPLYELALRNDKPAICRFRDEAPDRFRSSEYYRQYCERTHLTDEMDFLLDVDASTTLVLVVGRRSKRFSSTDLSHLREIGAIVQAGMRKLWDQQPSAAAPGGDRQFHQRLTRRFDDFGSGILTDREQEITRLLLRGFSTKAIARRLRIAPGTVMVHKRNLFSKLGISSQFELFSRFIESLAES
jgi:DNA-binding CsgD family transcriptional regulator